MKKIIYFILITTVLGCSNSAQVNSCFPNFSFNEVANLSNAEFVNLQVPGGVAYTTLGNRSLIIYRQSQSQYKVFDRLCPSGNCTSPMVMENLRIKCSCDGKEYNPLNGSPLDGEGCFALEYFANLVGNNSLQITR